MSRLHKIRGLFLLITQGRDSKNPGCAHSHLMIQQKTGETICVQCGKTIYMTRRPDDSHDDRFMKH